MIRYFPNFYPDELVYSLLSRYYAKVGHLAYRYAAEELFLSRSVRPDMDFVNAYTPEALRLITQGQSMEEVVLKHTMFPYYGHFLPKERRLKAFQALVSMQGNYHNLMPIPIRKDGSSRYLRYCPLCAKQDRELYGETYWHRTHQLIGITACPIHHCYLQNSSVIISGNAPPMLKSAEEVIPLSESIEQSSDIENHLAQYMSDVFQSAVDMESEVTVGQFLYSQMANTKYRSLRGQQRNMELLHADFTNYYRNLSNNWFTELWQIQKVLTDDRCNFFEVCLIAMFLSVSTDDLATRRLPEKSQQELFDEEIHQLHEQGLKYTEIAKQLGASYQLVKSIGCRYYGTYHKPSKTSVQSKTKSPSMKNY